MIMGLAHYTALQRYQQQQQHQKLPTKKKERNSVGYDDVKVHWLLTLF